jgi:hypothetical protein
MHASPAKDGCNSRQGNIALDWQQLRPAVPANHIWSHCEVEVAQEVLSVSLVGCKHFLHRSGNDTRLFTGKCVRLAQGCFSVGKDDRVITIAWTCAGVVVV